MQVHVRLNLTELTVCLVRFLKAFRFRNAEPMYAPWKCLCRSKSENPQANLLGGLLLIVLAKMITGASMNAMLSKARRGTSALHEIKRFLPSNILRDDPKRHPWGPKVIRFVERMVVCILNSLNPET